MQTASKKNPNSPVNLPKLSSPIPKSLLFSDKASPYVCCFGSGPIGQKLKDDFKSLGNSVKVNYLDAESLLGITENELKFIVRDAKTILLACDNPPESQQSKKGGWFESEAQFHCLDSKSLRRLLNAAVADRSLKSSSELSPLNVVALVKGVKESKGFASLLGGDTFSLEDDVQLLCGQRGFQCSVIRVGTVLPTSLDNDNSSKNIKWTDSNSYKRLKESVSALASSKSQVADLILSRPILLTTSRVDVTDFTTSATATEAMLRLGNYKQPHDSSSSSSSSSFNSSVTVSVLSTSFQPPTSQDWDDELVKLTGPELARLPLLYSDSIQQITRLLRVLQRLQKQYQESTRDSSWSTTLVTPINIEKYSNAIKIIFEPKTTNYLSYKEEKTIEKNKQPDGTSSVTALKKGGYMSPEEEVRLEKAAVEARGQETQKKVSTKKVALEGGLELLFDELPYRRVRIRRCNMGPQTIVKEESEALLLKTILTTIQTVENDAKILTSTFNK